MRYPASEKLEIIRLVEQSHLPVRRTLEKLGIQPARFYRWYDRLQTGGPKPWMISHQGRRASGTASLTQYANGSFSVYRLLKAASSIVCTPPRKHCRFHPFGRAVVT